MQVTEVEEDRDIEKSIAEQSETVLRKKKLEKRMWQRHMERSRKKGKGMCRACQGYSPSGSFLVLVTIRSDPLGGDYCHPLFAKTFPQPF